MQVNEYFCFYTPIRKGEDAVMLGASCCQQERHLTGKLGSPTVCLNVECISSLCQEAMISCAPGLKTKGNVFTS